MILLAIQPFFYFPTVKDGELLKNALKYTNGNKNRVNFYAIPSWVVQQLKTIEDNGIRWKDKGYRIGGISFDMFYRSEGFEVAWSLTVEYSKKLSQVA